MVKENPKVPLGGDFLRVVREQERRCEESFDEWLPGAGVRAPQSMDALGTALSYLDRIASCWWGCRQDTHIEERLVGKVASNARAALHLLRAGYYDEALGLVRQIGETANLACLFVQSAESHEEWKSASEEVARTAFSPVNRHSPDRTTFPGYSSRRDAANYNLAFQGRQMRPDSLKFLLSWTNHRPAKRKISKPLVYDQVSSLGSPFALYDPVTVINPDAPKVD